MLNTQTLPLRSLESPDLQGVHFRQAGVAGGWPVHGIIKQISLKEKATVLVINLKAGEPNLPERRLTYRCEHLTPVRVLVTGQIVIDGGPRLQFFTDTHNPLVSPVLFPPLPATA